MRRLASRTWQGAALIAMSSTILDVSADQQVIAVEVERPPVVDGRDGDAAWSRAVAVTTTDAVARIPITLKAVHNDGRVFFLVRFPDPTENRHHKTMLWDQAAERYRMGPAREDTFVFKWSREPVAIDMRLAAGVPHRADIWFWKAYRTDHAGHADDKSHIYGISPMRRSQTVLTESGHTFHLFRPGDDGDPAYRAIVHDRYVGDRAERYGLAQPTGSRADILAKGEWNEGTWTIEFARSLDTGHPDDVAFRTDRSYLFGVSRYEIAGRKRDPAIEQPDFGAGDVGERLMLMFR